MFTLWMIFLLNGVPVAMYNDPMPFSTKAACEEAAAKDRADYKEFEKTNPAPPGVTAVFECREYPKS